MSEIDLTSPEVKQAIADAVSEATQGLKDKNTELLGKLKKAQKDSAIDPADLEAAERERDEWKAKAQTAERNAAKAAKDLDAANKAKSDLEGAFHGSLRDAALTEELTKAGVTNPVHLKAAKALLGAQLSVAIEGDARVVKAGDKAVGDFIKTWASGDEGKHFVAATSSNGGGAQGAQPRNPNAPSVSRQAFEGMTPQAQMEHIQKQGVVTDA